jgi:YHYH protein
VTDAPQKGSVYLCRAPQGQAGGAGTRGPWFVNNNAEYDISKKLAVEGDVRWEGNYSETISGGSRVITTNDLPRDHVTGAFPVQPSDPANQYDRNPNQIAPQSLTYTLSAEPKVESSPSCLGGEVGVMLTGVALFNAFDAGGRDAGAWEVQDGCNGHPQISSEYHYHTLSSCIQDTSVSTVIGFALDGFPITGPKVGDDNILTTGDLDECHGITSTITLDGKQVETYHYVMTQDFPYSASCFRATATQPPGQPAGPTGQPAGPPAGPPGPPG